MGNDEATVYVGGLSKDISEEIVEELFIQSFTVKKADAHAYALIEFEDEESVPFAIEIMDGVTLHNRPINVKPRNNTKQEENWKRKQSERRRSDNRNSMPYISQVDSRKRDHNGHRQDGSGMYQDFRSPLPVPPMPPNFDRMAYMTPPPPPPMSVGSSFQGYKMSTERRDKWQHTSFKGTYEPQHPMPGDDRFADAVKPALEALLSDLQHTTEVLRRANLGDRYSQSREDLEPIYQEQTRRETRGQSHDLDNIEQMVNSYSEERDKRRSHDDVRPAARLNASERPSVHSLFNNLMTFPSGFLI